ncbi:MAG: PKD domain-containing protein, partial [Thermoplasmata archaeon]
MPKMALQVPQGELIIEPIVDNENEDYGDNIPQETGIIPRETRNGEEDYLSLVAEIGHGLNIGYQNSITYADVDNDGITEILFANEDGYIHVIQYLGGDYIDEWRSPNLDWEPYGLAVGDTDSDGTVEIVVGNHYGTIYIFGYQGPGIGYVKEWEYQLNKEEPYGIVVGNLDDDEYQEIVIGALQLVSAEENVFVFGYDGSTYVEEYRYLMTDFLNYAHSVVIYDVDSDGTDEFVVGTMEFKMGTQTPRGTFYVFGHNGNDYAVEYKRPDISDWVGDLDCGDVDDDGNPEIVVSGASVNIYQYESGAYFIENNIPEEHPKLQVGDVNNDGQIEIVTGYWELKVWQEDTLLWESETYEQEIYSVAIVDSDSDLHNEILFTKGVMDWYSDLYILGYSSLIFIEEWISDYLPSISSISVDDVNSDGENDLILATRPGDLIIFEDPMNQLQVRDAKKIEVGFEIIHVFCGNFDNDSTVDIVVTDTNDIIYFLEFDGVDYIIVDQIQIVDDSFVAADIDDIDDDGKIELVVATLNGYVHVVGYDGSYEIEWTDLIAENGITAITTGDSDNDGVKEILVGGFDNILHILIYDGSDYVEIREQLMSGMIFTLGIGDTDYDGKNELVAELGFFELRVFEWNGTYYVVNWSATFYEDANNEAMDVDFIESTNKDLIVFGTFKLYVIGYNTTYEFLYQSETYTSKVQSLIIGDLDKSGKNEILVSIGSYIFIYGKELRPLASLFVSKPTVNVGEEITFDGSFSKGIGTLEYFFDFGDGINTGWTSESVTTHSYSAGGTYEASLKIKDENGIESTNFAEITITVLESNVAPMAFIDEIYPSKATYKETVSFSGHGDDEDGT